MPRSTTPIHLRALPLVCALALCATPLACSRTALYFDELGRGAGGAGGASTTTATASTPSTTSSSTGAGGGAPGCPVATEPVVLAPVGAMGFLTIDDAFVYFTDTNAGRVAKVPLCGGEVTTIATLQTMPLGIAVNAANVYWANQGNLFSNGSVVFAPKTGGSAVTLASNQAAPWPVAVDEDAAYWWTHNGAGAIWRVPVGGGSPTELAADGGFAALSLDDDHVYWAFETVGRVAKIGGEPEIYAHITGSIGWCVAVDDTDVYWTTYVGTLQKVAKTGGSVTTLTPSGYQRCLALDETHVYFTQDAAPNFGVLRVPKAGGDVELLAADPAPSSIAVDAQNIYWTGVDGIMRMSK